MNADPATLAAYRQAVLALAGAVEVLGRLVEPPPPVQAPALPAGVEALPADEGPARVKVMPAEGLPPLAPVLLHDGEAGVLAVLAAEQGCLTGPEIAGRITPRRTCSSRFRDMLARMKGARRLLNHTPGEGYSITRLGQVSLAAWTASQPERPLAPPAPRLHATGETLRRVPEDTPPASRIAELQARAEAGQELHDRPFPRCGVRLDEG